MGGAPVTIVTSGGTPVTNGAGSPFTPVASGGAPVTVVASGGSPIKLINADGTDWTDITPTAGNLAANRTQYNTGTAVITQPFTSRRTHYAHGAGDISSIKTVDINRWINATATTSTGNTHTIKRYIEYPADVFHQVTWSAAATVSLTAGLRLTSDVVVSSVTGQPLVIPAGAKFWERTVILTSATVPVIIQPAGSDVLGIDDGNNASDMGNSGTITPTAGLNTLGCQGIIGTVNATAARSFVIIGDSLAFGSLDDTTVGAKGGSGWVARMLDNAGIPYMKWAYGGQQLTEQAALVATINADVGVLGFSDVIVQSGINDLRLSVSQANLEIAQQTIFTAANIVGKRKWTCTRGPRSTGTDWATLGDQAPQTDGNMAALTSVNAATRAGIVNAYGYIELADAAMPSRDANIHKAPPAGTPDGTHFNSTRAALVASLCDVDL